MRNIIVIGGGAAGLAATISLLSKDCDVLLISETLGGKAGTHQYLTNEQVEEYIPGEEVTRLFARRISTHVKHLLRDQVVAIAKDRNVFTVTTERSGAHEAGAVIFTTGVTPVPLNVPGAEQFAGYGIGYSATTHAQQLTGKRVAVIGSTQRALRGVHDLAQTAASISLIAPEQGMLLSPLGMALPYRYNVDLYEGAQVLAVEGSASVERVIIMHKGQQQQLAVDAVFVDLGLQPNTRMLREFAMLDNDGFIRVDAQRATNIGGLFAAGDATTRPSENILVAIGDGARAAGSAYDYMLAHPSLRKR